MQFLNSLALFFVYAVPAPKQVDAHAWTFRALGTQAGIVIQLNRGVQAADSKSPNDLHFQLYRGLSPHFRPNAASLRTDARVDMGSSGRQLTIFTDPARGLTQGSVYYYKLEVIDQSGEAMSLIPEGLGNVSKNEPVASAACMPFSPLTVVFIGDSITRGANLQSGDLTACDDCVRALALGPRARQIFFSNEGHDGYTTKDYLPGTDTFSHAEEAGKRLITANPGELVFSIMLGTNDSANAGTNGSPVSASQYQTNMTAIAGALLKDFPSCKVVVNRPLWYSPNTHNGATYEEEGLERLTSYFPVISKLPSKFSGHRVFVGDTRGFDYFASTYLTNLNAESGQNGTFYLHPNREGAQALGQLWAAAILRAVDH